MIRYFLLFFIASLCFCVASAKAQIPLATYRLVQATIDPATRYTIESADPQSNLNVTGFFKVDAKGIITRHFYFCKHKNAMKCAPIIDIFNVNQVSESRNVIRLTNTGTDKMHEITVVSNQNPMILLEKMPHEYGYDFGGKMLLTYWVIDATTTNNDSDRPQPSRTRDSNQMPDEQNHSRHPINSDESICQNQHDLHPI